uniref:Putative nachr subunit (inferred by orthology to a S. mansoni protein) n=1 Tax=Anisakis simplex TaxID=6269 RepID=A0A0M3K3C2_ANISI
LFSSLAKQFSSLTFQKWHDFQMKWNPVNYGEIQNIRVAPDKVWLPDIVLFNNADGNYEVSFMCNVVINHKGDMLWVPPAIYKSSCIIDVEFFPFDEQTCHLIFGSWTVMPKLLCMQRPKQLLRKMAAHAAAQKANGAATMVSALPGIGEFSLNPSAHHPFCPSADESRYQPPAIELTHSDSVRPFQRDPTTSEYYPLSADAMRAIDAIEYITDHLKQDEEYK